MKKPSNAITTLLCAAVLLLATSAGAFAETLGSRVLLLGIENVRNELNLNADQRRTLDRLRSSYRESAVREAQLRTPEAKARLDRAMQTFNQRALAVLTPAQQTKLNTILHQMHGAWMLTSPPVQQQLGLNADQVKTIQQRQQQLEVYTDKVNALAYEGKITNQQRVVRLRNYRLRLADAMEGMLTAGQRQKLTAIQGG